MWKKTLLAGTAALALAGSSLVYAQQPPGDAGSPDRNGGHPMFTAQDRAAFLDARIAALKAGLQLTPDQEKNWPAFETALRNLAKLRAERREAWLKEREAQAPESHADRLRRRAEALTSFGTALKQFADAEQPLFASLDEGQKNRFAMLSRMMRHHRMAMRGEREGWRGGMRERWHRGGGDGGWRGRGDDGDRGGGGGPGWHGHGDDGDRGGGPGGPGGRTDRGGDDTINGAAGGTLDAE